MDVVPDCKDFLCEFVSSLDSSEETVCNPNEVTDKVSSVSPNSEEVNQTDNVWLDVEEALHRWMCKILDVESHLEKSTGFRETIEASLRRQQQDGFLNHQDVAELRHVTNVWINLLNCTSSYTIGCNFVKRDIITYLVELYNLRQITKSLLVESCLRL